MALCSGRVPIRNTTSVIPIGPASERLTSFGQFVTIATGNAGSEDRIRRSGGLCQKKVQRSLEKPSFSEKTRFLCTILLYERKRYHTYKRGYDTAKSVLHIGTLSHYGEANPQCRNRLDLISPQRVGASPCGETGRRGFHSCAPKSVAGLFVNCIS